MRQRDDDCTCGRSRSDDGGLASLSSNAFCPEFLHDVAEQEPEPAVPEAELAGPWRVVKLHGDGDPVWAVYACGERRPAVSFQEPDLAHLAAAAVAKRPARFGMLTDGAGTVHVRHDGRTVGTASIAGDSLPLDLTRLAELRAQPLALAHLLRSVPEAALRRTGAILASMARGREWSEVPG
jgi:hypothetical protein